MRTLNSLAVLFAIGCYVPLALADDASVTISSPADGAKLGRAMPRGAVSPLTIVRRPFPERSGAIPYATVFTCNCGP